MPQGRRTRRNPARFVGILVALIVSLAAGCQRLSVSRIQPVTLPSGPPAIEFTDASVATIAPGAGRTPGSLIEKSPMSIASGGRPPASATPMLDAAYQRARIQEQSQVAPERDDSTRLASFEPPLEEPTRTTSGTAVESEAKTETGSTSVPGGFPVQVVASVPAEVPKTDPKVEATASLMPERVDAPEGPARPINPETSITPSRPRDVWRENLDRLRSVARDHVDEPGSDTNGLWSTRVRILDLLDEPESQAMSEEGNLRRSLLYALAPTIAEPSTPGTAVRAAIEALEAKAPLQITELQLCRKVKGFGDFEPLEAMACRPGHGVIVYCEMLGVHYEPEGSLHRSRLASRVEVVASSGGEPLWSQPLGTADDLCRRRRRDYYVNYRITLPESLVPGSYDLRLIQEDLIAEKSTSCAVPLLIQP